MNEGNTGKLKVVDMSDEQVSTSDLMPDRHYRTIYVVPHSEDTEGAISTSRPHGRNIWDQQPMDGRKNPFYDAIVDAYEKYKNGERDKPPIITGRIETVETEPYFIPNERGSDEKDGEKGNFVEEKTYVLFEDETADRFLRNDGLVRRGEGEPGKTVSKGEPFAKGEELTPEDVGEEAEEVDVS